jgi:hypothetical protein
MLSSDIIQHGTKQADERTHIWRFPSGKGSMAPMAADKLRYTSKQYSGRPREDGNSSLFSSEGDLKS